MTIIITMPNEKYYIVSLFGAVYFVALNDADARSDVRALAGLLYQESAMAIRTLAGLDRNTTGLRIDTQ